MIIKYITEETTLHFHPLWSHLPHLAKYLLGTILIFTNHEGYPDPATHVRDRLVFVRSTEVGQEIMKGGLQGAWRECVSISP